MNDHGFAFMARLVAYWRAHDLPDPISIDFHRADADLCVSVYPADLVPWARALRWEEPFSTYPAASNVTIREFVIDETDEASPRWRAKGWRLRVMSVVDEAAVTA